MSELIAFDVFRTEKLDVDGETYTVYFSKRRDGEETKISAIPDQGNNKGVVIHFSMEGASDFYAARGHPLSDEVVELLAEEVRIQYPKKV